MGVLGLSVVLVVLALVVAGNCSPVGYWDHWMSLQQDKGHQDTQQKPKSSGSRIWEAYQRQQQLEEQQEQEEDRLSAIQSILEDNNLEEVALTLGMDVLGSIIKPETSGPHRPTCVTKRAPVTVLLLTGEFVYTVCGSGDAASLHFRFKKTDETTPGVDVITTPADTTPFPLCLNFPTTTPPLTTPLPNTTLAPTNTTVADTQTTTTEPETTTTPA